jgi:glycosyltransferase involved in cell wall biosynthesis
LERCWQLRRHIFGWLARLVSRDNSAGQAKLSIWKRLHGGPRAMSTCDVILAVWNGQNYLPAMLDSLLSQTTSDFNVLVRDDGSTDGSLEILENYKPKFDGRLSVIAGKPTGSATANFAILMRETKANYVLFADQDDVWKPEKVKLTLRSLKDAEAKYGKSTPIYFATDIAVVNKDLEMISPSYWKWKRLKPSMMGKLSQSLICVPIQGMASGINRALLDLSNPVAEKAISHDWWAQLIAAAMGKVICDPTVTALYRVHGGNASVPKEVGLVPYLKLGLDASFLRRGLGRRIEQANALADALTGRMPPDKLKIIRKFTRLQSQGFVQRRLTLVGGNYLYHDLVRNVATFTLM